MKRALIIGAGVSGLASAIRMAAAGYAVEVHEQADTFGGKMGELRQGGFRFDTGPSLFTWPALLEELFVAAGRRLSDYIPYHRLDTITRYHFADGTSFDAPGDPGAFASELENLAGEPAENTMQYLKDCRRLFDLTRPVFLEDEIRIGKVLSSRYLRAYPSLPQLKAWLSLHRYNQRVFSTSQAIQLFDRYATYNGSDPFTAPATLRVIAHLEHNEGAYFPTRGIYSIASGMYQLGSELGVIYHFNSRVGKPTISRNRIREIETSQGSAQPDVVISSADISGPSALGHGRPIPADRLSSSALIFYWGMKGISPGLSLHNVFFSSDYAEEFRRIFHNADMADDLTVYLFISSKEVPGDAPEGSENWFVMVNAPPDRGQDWEHIKHLVRTGILRKLSRVLGYDPSSRIMCESIVAPPDIARHSGAYRGALYGANSNALFSAFRRHPNQGKYANLYHTGGSVHPGGGIPLCLLSARIVANKICNA